MASFSMHCGCVNFGPIHGIARSWAAFRASADAMRHSSQIHCAAAVLDGFWTASVCGVGHCRCGSFASDARRGLSLLVARSDATVR